MKAQKLRQYHAKRGDLGWSLLYARRLGISLRQVSEILDVPLRLVKLEWGWNKSKVGR